MKLLIKNHDDIIINLGSISIRELLILQFAML